jgi:TRAP-type C4-dicarboxylate transport system permease small subunit
VFISLLVSVYVAVVTIFGWRLMLVGQYQVSPAFQIKMSYVYIVFPLGGGLMFLEAVLKTVSYLKKTEAPDSALSNDRSSFVT